MNSGGNQRRNLTICILLIVVSTLATYWPVLKNDFINYDDPDYVTTNDVVQKGLTTEGIKWAFTTGHASNWHPITWLSHMLDVTMFGMNPMGHHATNVVFHVANSVLLLLLLRQMTGALWCSAMVAALFALHPLHVESVAWIAERKDVLSAFFGLLTLMAYAAYARSRVEGRGSRGKYALSLLLFALGLMSKPMLVTWPFVMLLLDFWPLERFKSASGKTWSRLVVEKLPFFALVIASCAITLNVQRGAMSNGEIITLTDRTFNAVLAYTSYLHQTIWPTNLAMFYPFPIEIPLKTLALPLVLLVGASLISLKLVTKHPFVMVGWCWFLGTLVPVIGILQVGAQAHADRYTYLPLIGIFVILCWSVSELIKRHSSLIRPLIVAAVSALVVLSRLSHDQLAFWKNDRALCTHAAEVTDGNYVALGGIAIQDIKQENWPRAMTNLFRAYEYAKPRHTERSVEYYIGVALQMQGKPLDALPYLENCVVSVEMQPERDHRLGLSFMEAGRLPEAEASLTAALTAKPNTLNYILGLAALHQAKGNPALAEQALRNAITQHPNSPLAAKSYGDFLITAKRMSEALNQYANAIKLKPTNLTYRKLYANALLQAGNPKAAANEYETIFKAKKPTTEDLLQLADIYSQISQPRNVLDCYDRLIAADPNSIAGLNNLAWMLATHKDNDIRNGKRAVELAQRACEITQWKIPILIGTLAAAYAESGDFTNAVQMVTRARDAARADKQEDVAKRNQELLEVYSAGKAFRED